MRRKNLEAALDLLVLEKIVTLKEYGKAKVYLVNQSRFPEVDKALLTALDDQISLRRSEFNELSGQVKELDKQMKDSSSSLTNKQINDMIEST